MTPPVDQDHADLHLDRVLAAVAGPQAVARDDQRTAVRALVVDRRRVLVVQATGWGKSAVYWAATSALRAAGAGPTLVVSPLLALMRDQVAAAERAGLTAATINSTNLDDWDTALSQLAEDRLDVLLVSPERLANPRFARHLERLMETMGLVVIDEAHCVSDWGFDFRPDYQRLSKVLTGVGRDTPVLATTATANHRVTVDVADQLGPDTLTLRGSLARSSLRLAVVPELNALERYAWVDEALADLDGSGIVYVLTVAETERLAGFLAQRGHSVAAYSGGLDPEARQQVEDQLRDNQLKAVVATSALGMGYDKPDLGFCIHVGSPSSPVAYYQQVGRAGRALDHAAAVLLPAETDAALWRYFATSTVPDPDDAAKVLDVLAGGARTLAALETATGVRRGRLEALLKILAVDGATERAEGGWASTGTGWVFDAAKYEALVAARAAEAQLMAAYASGQGCLMAYLQRALDDDSSGPCGRCSVCTDERPGPAGGPSPASVEAARAYVRGRDVIIEPRKLWPAGLSGRKGRIQPGCQSGRALAFADDAGWASEMERFDRGDGPVADEVVDGLVEVLRRFKAVWPDRPQAVVAVPSRSHPQRVASLAERIAAIGHLPVIDAFAWQGPPAPTDSASGVRAAALLAGLVLRPDAAIPAAPILLVDDTLRSGWTMTVAGAALGDAGATAVWPLVVHRLP
jgi:ATP-dependent DNA helicase RecQ